MNKIKEFFKTSSPIIIPTVVMLVICIVVTLALSGTNLLTKEKIADMEAKTQNDSMKEVLSADNYNEKTAKIDGEEVTYYEAESSGKVIGNIFVIIEKGYGGDLKVMCAIDSDNTVKSVKVLDASNETPGLGQNTANEDFYGQYSGLHREITVQKGSAKSENNEINAVTGATISSKAVTSAVNKALSYNEHINEKEAW